MKQKRLDVIKLIHSSLQNLKCSLMQINTTDVLLNTVCKQNKIGLQGLQFPSSMLACKNKQLTSGLVSKTWDIGELFKITPTLIFKPWDTGETYETSIFPRTKINKYNLILCDSKVPEVEIDPGPLPLN